MVCLPTKGREAAVAVHVMVGEMDTGERSTIRLRGGGSVKGIVSKKPDPNSDTTDLFSRLERDAVRQGTRLGRELAAGVITRRDAHYSLRVWVARAACEDSVSHEDVVRLEITMIRAVQEAKAKAKEVA